MAVSEDDRVKIARQLSGSFARVLRELAQDCDRRILQAVQARGHPDLRPAHRVVFSNLGLGRARVTELAERARVTQQAMGKTLKELENLGYIERAVDGSDRRARAIRLTDRGVQVVEEAIEADAETQAFYAEKAGSDTLEQLDQLLREVAVKLELDYLPLSWAEATER